MEDHQIIIIDPKNRKVVEGVLEVDLGTMKATIFDTFSFSKNEVVWNVAKIKRGRLMIKEIELKDYLILDLNNLKIMN